MTETSYYVEPADERADQSTTEQPKSSGGGGGGNREGGGEPTPAFQPSDYTFALNSFRIHTMRSRSTATDTVSFSDSLEGGTTQTKIEDVGALGERFEPYFVGLTQGPIHISRHVQVVAFSSVVVNSGLQSQEETNARITGIADQLAAVGAAALMKAVAATYEFPGAAIPAVGA